MHERIPLGPDDVGEGQLRGYEKGARHILVTRVDGALFALDDWCNHAGCLLSGGRVERRAVVCPCHEYTFDLSTGRNITWPRLCDDQPRFDVISEGGTLFLLADPEDLEETR